MIISVNNREKCGFYSTFFFTLNHYIYAVKNNLNFKLDSSMWTFKYKLGWEDYFCNIDILDKNENNSDINVLIHDQLCHENNNLYDYRCAIEMVYKYNDTVKTMIENKKKELNMNDNYCSIFIRRGDKLFAESIYVPTDVYINILLRINPNCDTIFLQTDDYNCYLDILEYLKSNNLNIKVVCLCKEIYKGGMIIYDEKYKIENNINPEYILTVANELKNNKCIEHFNSEEIFEHFTDMLIGIDIVLNSSLVVCDYSSNVARFIKLAHKNPNCVFNIFSLNDDIDWNCSRFPAYNI